MKIILVNGNPEPAFSLNQVREGGKAMSKYRLLFADRVLELHRCINPPTSGDELRLCNIDEVDDREGEDLQILLARPELSLMTDTLSPDQAFVSEILTEFFKWDLPTIEEKILVRQCLADEKQRIAECRSRSQTDSMPPNREAENARKLAMDAKTVEDAVRHLTAAFPALKTDELHAGFMHSKGETWQAMQTACECSKSTLSKHIRRYYKITNFPRADRRFGMGSLLHLDESRDAG